MGALREGEDEFVSEADWDTELLGEAASDSIFEFRSYTRSGREATPDAVSALARAGLLLSLARPRLPDPAAWAAFLKQNDISRLEASDAVGAYSTVGTDGTVAVPSVAVKTPVKAGYMGNKIDNGNPAHTDDRFPMLLTMTRVNGVVERLVEDLPALESTAEPKDAIGQEITRAIDMLRTLEERIAR